MNMDQVENAFLGQDHESNLLRSGQKNLKAKQIAKLRYFVAIVYSITSYKDYSIRNSY